MSEGYAKLFSDIVDSSIWEEDSDTCKVWVTMLALCNADGFLRGSAGWLAGKAKVTLGACSKALAKFESPDLKSRTLDNDGRRIERLEDGWLVLNYLLFRDRLSTNPKAVKTRERVRKHRERYNALHNVTGVTPCHSASASASESVPKEKESVRERGFKKPELPEVALQCAKIMLPETEAQHFIDYYEANGWRVGRNPMRSWQSALSNWKRNYEERKYDNGHSKTSRNHNPRNEGIIRGKTDYGAAAIEKQKRQAIEYEEKELARQMAETQTDAPQPENS